jgi:hypothetical protein
VSFSPSLIANIYNRRDLPPPYSARKPLKPQPQSPSDGTIYEEHRITEKEIGLAQLNAKEMATDDFSEGKHTHLTYFLAMTDFT